MSFFTGDARKDMVMAIGEALALSHADDIQEWEKAGREKGEYFMLGTSRG